MTNYLNRPMRTVQQVLAARRLSEIRNDRRLAEILAARQAGTGERPLIPHNNNVA